MNEAAATLPRPPPADLVVDTSALVAILRLERDAERCSTALFRASGPVMSAASVLELLMVSERHQGPAGAALAKTLLTDAQVVTVPVDATTTSEAHAAWQRFGKGRHPAGLNYGDCFTYALARRWELPLLCVGDDFARTDLTLA